MTGEAFQPSLDFDAADVAAEGGEALILDLDGFEGPLHLLLALARSQKVDLRQISIAGLADQYLAFVGQARRRRFALAADYLVMAAWLTYLKSRLLLPKAERKAQEPAGDLAEALAFRLAKLDAMRQAAEGLKALPRTGRDVFTRGEPEGAAAPAGRAVEGDLFQLLAAYVGLRRRREGRRYQVAARIEAYPLEAARLRLRELLPTLQAWTPLGRVAPAADDPEGPGRASYLASTFAAGLEMVKDGALEARQLEAFAALYLRARAVSSQPVGQAA